MSRLMREELVRAGWWPWWLLFLLPPWIVMAYVLIEEWWKPFVSGA